MNRRLILILPALVFFGLAFLPGVLQILPNWLWFKSFGYDHIWLFFIQAKLVAFSLFFVVSYLFITLNLRLARVIVQKSNIGFQHPSFSGIFSFLGPLFEQLNQQSGDPHAQAHRVNLVIRWGSLLGAAFFGIKAAGNWQLLFDFWNQTPFQLTDPIFGHNIAFYVFTLPFIKTVLGIGMGLILLTAALCLWVYGTRRLIMFIFGSNVAEIQLKRHIFTLFALLFAFLAAQSYLSGFDILYNNRATVFGAGFTDIHIELLYHRIQCGLWVIQAVLMLIFAFRREVHIPILFLGVLLANGLLLGGIAPGLIQTYYVAPNEFQAEKPYLENNIKYTRAAYDLTHIVTEPFEANNQLRLSGIQANQATIQNIRLWNEEPLQQTFSQLQEIRLYYEFPDIDVDRYTINNNLQQVMLSAREMNHDALSEQAQTWINRHLIYTHGYGLCMSPVNRVSSEGLPEFLIKDIPPISMSPNLSVTRPQIYFGEKTNDYVITNTTQPEFDYPKGSSNQYTRYSASGGVQLNHWIKKAIFAIAFNDIKILISPAIQPNSRILYMRNIHQMVQKLAPFIIFEDDAYLVVRENGHLVWMIDGYTTTNAFPYAEPFGQSGRNYIRNAVKVTIDAYSGETRFYLSDANDPIIQTYAKVYQNMFRPLAEMPADLRQHIRYPKDLFQIQAKMLSTYHMTDPQVFYNREDQWDIPVKTSGSEDDKGQMQPYYLVTKLPKESKETFILMLPFTPTHKANMIAWLSAKCDPDQYGQLKVYQFPKERTIYGPQQIDSRINQDTEISQDLTLWGQLGSRVVKGNLMAIPVDQSLIYVEPIYLQATQSKLPELKRVIVAFDDQVVMSNTLENGISQIFGGSSTPPSRPTPQTTSTPNPTYSAKALISKLTSQFNAAKKSLKQGNWKEFGVQFEELDHSFQNAESENQ